MSQEEEARSPFSLIADFDGDISQLINEPFPATLPVLPVRNLMLFPGVVAPISVGRESSRQLIRHVSRPNAMFAVVCQKDAGEETPKRSDLHNEGVVARVMKAMTLPDGNITVILQAFGRCTLGRLTRTQPFLRGTVSAVKEDVPAADDKEFTALVGICKETTQRLLRASDTASEETAFALNNISNPVFLINFICTNLPISSDEKVSLLCSDSITQRAYRLLGLLNRELQYAKLRNDIQEKTREELDKQQKEYFLQQQIKSIQHELGDGEGSDVQRLREEAAKLAMPKKVKQLFDKELTRLGHFSPQNPDYNVQLTYLDTLVQLPWGVTTSDNLDIPHAQRILDRDHYGMEKVKERILEHLACLRLRRAGHAPILCLYGPPGVGKTSLGRSIAEALGRKYVRVSLGGVHDEAEVRGHRRTYIGAMPGRIIKSLTKAGSSNPVFILDEIDKVSGNNYNGDPLSALLEVLDPEQNNAFHDNYLDIDFDLSQVFFIATANTLSTIPAPLLDRMELIEVEGYLTEEKKEIARRHLIPKEQAAIDFGEGVSLRFTPSAIEHIIERYTRESGVRQLEKQLGKLFRKVAYRTALDGQMPYAGRNIKPADVTDVLGNPPFSREAYQGNRYAGVVTGLAWTAAGGEILFIETAVSRSKAPKLTLTGNLGDVMKESAVLALEYIKTHAEALGIAPALFDCLSVHIHVPEGATPKDGPSAGITIATSIASAFTQRRVHEATAMTGEITLRGRVLPVGGIKEKILAARRAGIKRIVMSSENKKDIQEIKPSYIDGLTFFFVDTVDEVFKHALLPERVPHALDLAAILASEEKDLLAAAPLQA